MKTLMAAVLVVLVGSWPVHADEKEKPALAEALAAKEREKPPARPDVQPSFRVHLTIRRLEGDKVVSTLTHAAVAMVDAKAVLKVGDEVPIVVTEFKALADKGPAFAPASSTQFRSTGTYVTFRIRDPRASSGAKPTTYPVELSIEQSSIVGADQPSPSFKVANANLSFGARAGTTYDVATLHDPASKQVLKADFRMEPLE